MEILQKFFFFKCSQKYEYWVYNVHACISRYLLTSFKEFFMFWERKNIFENKIPLWSIPASQIFESLKKSLFLPVFQKKNFLTKNSEKTTNVECSQNFLWTTILHENGQKNFQRPASTQSPPLKNPRGGESPGFPLES